MMSLLADASSARPRDSGIVSRLMNMQNPMNMQTRFARRVHITSSPRRGRVRRRSFSSSCRRRCCAAHVGSLTSRPGAAAAAAARFHY